jgi:prolyl 4-hydroxylase
VRRFSGHDCFEVGRAAYNSADFYHTLFWMQEAYNRVENESPPTASMTDILEYLSFSLYQQGNVKRALALTKRLAALGMC